MLSDEIPPATASAKSAPEIGPVRPKERIETIDILRGWAILGILLVNMLYYGSPSLVWVRQAWGAPADQAAVVLIGLLAVSKFWPLLSFLFGLGFGLQMQRAETRGIRFFPLYRRRLLVLLFFGLVHYLMWFGDYLHLYAVLGFLLFFFRTRSTKTLVVTAFVCLLIPWAHGAAVTGIRELRLPAQQLLQEKAQRTAERRDRDEKALRAYSQGTFREIPATNAERFARGYSSLDDYLGILGDPFPLFFLGLYAARRRIFENIRAHLPFIRKVMWWGLGLGLAHISLEIFTLLLTNPATPYLINQVNDLFWRAGAPALGFFYASGITLLVQREAWKKRLAPLAAVGRLALSNYLFQTLVCTTIFYSYGLGFYGKVGPAAGLALTVLIFALQILLSVWWVRRFRFGPMEWLWRTLTYGKLQPMRVR